jgi:hypothetical protein
MLAGSAAHAQPSQPAEPLKVSGSVRARYEALDGQVRPGLSPRTDLVNLRTTLFAEYDAGPVRFGGELYDSRTWDGDAATPVTTGEVNALEPVQAYAAIDLDRPFGGGTAATVQVGRFLLNLGSRRLVAADDYRNTTNGFTGARVDLALPDRWASTLIYTAPQTRLPDDTPSLLENAPRLDREDADAILWGAVVSRAQLAAGLTGEAAYLRFEEQDGAGRPTRDRALDTISLRLIREPAVSRLDGEVEIMRQTGRTRRTGAAAEPLVDVEASFLHADFGYTLPHRWKPRLSAEFDYASGDEGGSTFGRFDTLFGSRRSDLAPSGLYSALGRANLITPGVRVEVAPSKRWDAFAAYRLLWLASNTDAFSTSGVRDPSGRTGDFAGAQLEGRLRYWIVPDTLRFEVDALWLDKGEFLRKAPNAPRTGDATYVSWNLTASF